MVTTQNDDVIVKAKEVSDSLSDGHGEHTNPIVLAAADYAPRGLPTCLILHGIICSSPDGHPSVDLDELKSVSEFESARMVQWLFSLGYSIAPLRWRKTSPEQDPSSVKHWAIEDRQRWLDATESFLTDKIFERGELPSGWKSHGGQWPIQPIQNPRDLRAWLQIWLDRIHLRRVESREFLRRPADYDDNFGDLANIDDIRRELRNARRTLRAMGITCPLGFDDNPADVLSAERQLELLVDGLPKPAGEEQPETTGITPKLYESPADVDDAGGGNSEAADKQPKKKRGRPRGSLKTDPKADAMMSNEWAEGYGKFASLEDLAAEMQKPVDDVRAALKRHKTRQSHSK